MKHIGIVDITTVGACICANEIVTESIKRNGAGIHPEFTIHALPFSIYRECVLKEDWQGMARAILSSIEKLYRVGAEFIIIPSNTPHYAIHEIIENSPLPVLNLLDLVADECLQRGYKKVVVLGTKPTMTKGLYNSYLAKRGITPIVPADSDCDLIHELIFDHIIPLKEDRHTMAKNIAEHIIKKLDCDAVILGCTELPEVYSELEKPVVDTTRLLAHKAIDFSFLQSLENESRNTFFFRL